MYITVGSGFISQLWFIFEHVALSSNFAYLAIVNIIFNSRYDCQEDIFCELLSVHFHVDKDNKGKLLFNLYEYIQMYTLKQNFWLTPTDINDEKQYST